MYKDKVLVLVHVPKTAGSALTSIICKQYNSNEVFSVSDPSLNIENKVSKINENTKVVFGHNYFGQHKNLGPHIHVTMLRDPIDRVISHYYYIKEILKDNELTDKYSLEEFAQLDEFSNMQTHFIAGNKQDLEQAINNLSTFAFFGITELFNESLFLMKKTFGWENIAYKKENVNTKKPKKQTISKEIIKQIEKANQLDIQLYDWAKENFENRLKTLEETESKLKED